MFIFRIYKYTIFIVGITWHHDKNKTVFYHEQLLKKCPIKSERLQVTPRTNAALKKCENSKNRYPITIALSARGVVVVQTLVPSFIKRVIFFGALPGDSSEPYFFPLTIKAT
jgi:hypothetical protein